jgi:co-chaperonin GroES (HSP10)
MGSPKDLQDKLKPLNGHIIVAPIKREELSTSILQAAPSASSERTELGEVIAVSDDGSLVKVGDKVYFRRYSPDEIEVEGVIYLVLTEQDVIAIKLS